MDITRLTGDQVAALSGKLESHFHDRKSIRVSPAKLTKTISAFANADGGELIVGIEDAGKWHGLESVEAFNGHLQAFEGLFPYGSEFDYTFLENPDSQTFALQVAIQKTREVKYASDGRAYVRRGAQSLPVPSIDELNRAKGVTTHETATLKYDTKEITNSEVVIRFMLSVIPSAEPSQWLRKQNLIVGDLPTVAGTLLYHDEPQVHLPKAAVKLYRYATTEAGSREHLAYDPIAIEGCIYDVITSAVAQTVEQVEAIPILETTGFKRIHYPQETLHEIITNAVIHRDYAVNDDVHVRIFENRIEIQSPGSLPANITPRNILEERYSRNPMIVRLLNKFPDPPNKDVGEGLNTAFDAMRKLELRSPEIVDTGTSVLVIIRHEGLASPESRIVQYLRENESINNPEARRLLNRPEAERSIRRYFEKLTKAGEIERVPGTIKRGTRYRLKTPLGAAVRSHGDNPESTGG